MLALLSDLDEAGYDVRDVPQSQRALLDALAAGSNEAKLALAQYQKLLANLPSQARECMFAAWGEPSADPDLHDGAFCAQRDRPGRS